MRKVLISDGKVYVTDERWVTIGGEDEDGSGQHVLIKENGNIVAGFGTGKNVRSVFGEKKADTPGKANAAVKKASQTAKNQVLNFRFNDPKAFADSEAEAKEKLNKAREMARKYPTDKDAQRRLAEAKGYVDGYKERREKGQVPKSWEEREAKRKRERLDTPEKANAAVKAKPKAGATYTDASAKFKNVAHRLDIDGSKSTDAYKYAQRLTKAAEKGGEQAVKNEIEKIKKTIDSTGDKTLKGLRKEHLDYVLEKAYGKKLDTAAKRYKDLVDTGGTYYAYSTNGRIGTLRDKIDRLSRQLKKASPEKAGGIKERLDKAKELRATLIKEREDAFSKIKNAPKLKNEEYYNKKVERFEKLAKRREEETGNYFDPRAERLRDRAQRMKTLRYMSSIQKEYIK